MRCVIFDLDGTLADTSGDLIAAANACFERRGHGVMLDAGKDAATAFHGGRAMLRLGADRLGLDGDAREALVEAEYPFLLEAYANDIDRFTVLYPGVERALDALAATGYALGVCTNKPEGLAEELLGRLNLRARFGSMIGADTLPTRKPDAAPLLAAIEQAGGAVETALIVGDTLTDRGAARAAGVPCVLVTFGPTGRAVSELEPEALLDHYDALPGVVAGLIG